MEDTMSANRKYVVRLTDEEREGLEAMVRKGGAAAEPARTGTQGETVGEGAQQAAARRRLAIHDRRGAHQVQAALPTGSNVIED